MYVIVFRDCAFSRKSCVGILHFESELKTEGQCCCLKLYYERKAPNHIMTPINNHVAYSQILDSLTFQRFIL